MAYIGNVCSYQFNSDWDLPNFEVFNNDHHDSLDPFSLDMSTGYLQDAVDDWFKCCKRRRVSSSDSVVLDLTNTKECVKLEDDGCHSENSRCTRQKSLNPEHEDGQKKVAYPFDLVKPGGIKGDVTLNEINERLMMRPKRSIRHPVGEFACNPCVLTTGLGPSGKAVVAITRIHTQGRGTVTIVKTRS
ncbi:hypothetical protein ACHQM5_005551 [Ranunculus cassubicifolius]